MAIVRAGAGEGSKMTQSLRIKWVLGLVSANAVIASIALGLGIHQYRTIRVQAETARDQLRASELDAAGLRASLASRPVTCEKAQPADSQLTQTLQVLATGQQALLLRALQPVEPPQVEQPKAQRASARRAPRTWRRPVTTCKVP
jgi:hypothetical protein